MKRLIIALCVACAALAMLSCKEFASLTNAKKKTSQGAPYELIVVCKGQTWDSALGDSLRVILKQPVAGINQTEPMFDVMRVAPDDFKQFIALHRNVLKVLVSPDVKEPTIAVQYDVTAAPQIMLTLQGPTVQSLTEYLSQNRQNLLYVLEKAERDRTIDYSNRFTAKLLPETMHKLFGIKMNVPKGYELRTESEDFLWASFEFPSASQGFFAYSYPYTGTADLKQETLIKRRNEFASRIPGPTDGSYMTTVTKIPDASGDNYYDYAPSYSVIRIDGRLWVEMRGLWQLENGFMGGPFVSYTTVDTATNRVFTLDGYVFSPKNPKRNYLREVEHLVYLVNFPAATDKAE